MSAALLPDEVQCQWCGDVFISSEAYEAHQPRKKGVCWGTSPADRYVRPVKLPSGKFGFDAKDPTRKPRRTKAMNSLDRVVQTMSWPRSAAERDRVQRDIDVVEAALRRARDHH